MAQKESKDEEPIDPRWYSVSTFRDLLELGAEYIIGRLSKTPNYPKPLTAISPSLKEKLLLLHKYGLYTTDGQESYSYYDFYGPSNVVKERDEYGNEWVDEEQRGYLTFYIDLEENSEFGDLLFQQIRKSGLYYTYYNFKNNETITNIHNKVNDFYAINVTRMRSSKTKDGLQSSSWDEYTNIHSVLKPAYIFGQGYNSATISILKKTAYFTVVLPKYGEGDLESLLIEMCEKVTNKMYKFKFEK
jgi:hypothetical protein